MKHYGLIAYLLQLISCCGIFIFMQFDKNKRKKNQIHVQLIILLSFYTKNIKISKYVIKKKPKILYQRRDEEYF